MCKGVKGSGGDFLLLFSFFSFPMKNVAITFLHADQRVQITSLKRVIRLLLKKRVVKGGTNPDIYAWMYVYLYMHTPI